MSRSIAGTHPHPSPFAAFAAARAPSGGAARRARALAAKRSPAGEAERLRLARGPIASIAYELFKYIYII